MYDELARAQKPGHLERFVVNALIPSVVLTFALHDPAAAHASRTPPLAPFSTPPFVLMTPVCGPPWPALPDVFPVLVSMPHVGYPAGMPRAGVEGRVLLKALVNAAGRIDSRSVLVLRTTDVRFIRPAREALLGARFRPAWSQGQRVAAWVTVAIDFSHLGG
jgi:TonB family protein